jgi:hypothetical protein
MHGFNILIPIGGQHAPSTILGHKLYEKMLKRRKKEHNFRNNK